MSGVSREECCRLEIPGAMPTCGDLYPWTAFRATNHRLRGRLSEQNTPAASSEKKDSIGMQPSHTCGCASPRPIWCHDPEFLCGSATTLQLYCESTVATAVWTDSLHTAIDRKSTRLNSSHLGIS